MRQQKVSKKHASCNAPKMKRTKENSKTDAKKSEGSLNFRCLWFRFRTRGGIDPGTLFPILWNSGFILPTGHLLAQGKARILPTSNNDSWKLYTQVAKKNTWCPVLDTWTPKPAENSPNSKKNTMASGTISKHLGFWHMGCGASHSTRENF